MDKIIIEIDGNSTNIDWTNGLTIEQVLEQMYLHIAILEGKLEDK